MLSWDTMTWTRPCENISMKMKRSHCQGWVPNHPSSITRKIPIKRWLRTKTRTVTQFNISGPYIIRNVGWGLTLHSHEYYAHTIISGIYAIEKHCLRTNLEQFTHTKISGERTIKKCWWNVWQRYQIVVLKLSDTKSPSQGIFWPHPA